MVIEKLRNSSYMVEFDTGQIMPCHIRHLKEDKTEGTLVIQSSGGETANKTPATQGLGGGQAAK